MSSTKPLPLLSEFNRRNPDYFGTLVATTTRVTRRLLKPGVARIEADLAQAEDIGRHVEKNLKDEDQGLTVEFVLILSTLINLFGESCRSLVVYYLGQPVIRVITRATTAKREARLDLFKLYPHAMRYELAAQTETRIHASIVRWAVILVACTLALLSIRV